MRRGDGLRAIALASGLLGWLTAAAGAQRRVEITPFVGGYVPTTTLGPMRVAHVLSQPVQVTGEMETNGVVGGRVGVWTGSRWGLEGTFVYAASDLRIIDGPVSGTVKANVQAGTLKAFFRATSENSGTDLFLSAGASGVQHAGRAFDLAAHQMDFGGVVGGGLHVLMSPQVTFRIDADLLVYPWSFGGSGLNESRTQTDLLVTLGLALRFAR